MNDWIYTARKRFAPGLSAGWDGYIEFSEFRHIEELISIDSLLCPDLITEIKNDDWAHNIHQDFRLTYFRDLDYLLKRTSSCQCEYQILALLENPTESAPHPSGFIAAGFDIVDDCSGNSALTNCGPMPEIFSPADVNCYGLVAQLDYARVICAKMRSAFPDDPHLGDCGIWQVARRLPG